VRIIVGALMMMAAAGGPAAGQPAPPQPSQPLTLADAVSRALETSHRLAEIRSRQAGARAVVDARAALDKPTTAASVSYSRTNHVVPFGFTQPDGSRFDIYPDIPDNVITRMSLQWPVYTSGRTGALERAAAAEVSAVGADLDAARADLKLEVTRAYWAVATSIETVRVLEASMTRAAAQLEDARQRLAVGLVPPNDVFSFEAQRASEQLQLIEARNIRESALIELRRLIGADPTAALIPADPLDAPPAFGRSAAGPGPNPPVVVEVAANYVAEALKQRPERQALTFRIGGSEQRELAAATGTKPTVGVAGGVDFANPNPKIFPRQGEWKSSWDLGVNLTWPLFDSGRTKAEVAEAAAATQAARDRLADLDTLLAADVRQRLLDLDSSLAAVETAQAGVRSATEARRVLGERFAVGVATTTDVLVAQEQLLSAELARARALANVRLAEARLTRALGRP
jgi:outer membrane protein TolC